MPPPLNQKRLAELLSILQAFFDFISASPKLRLFNQPPIEPTLSRTRRLDPQFHL